ncbi:MAG TPA: NUDIX hydrolase, partial [Cryptosporangiaceae bacterium]|nr:NUDIX hydrolase [Cryptosporangiaceae bacterium]
MRFGVPAQVAQRVQAWPGGVPAPTRDAATVVLLRDGAAGIEAFLLVRTGAMAAFAGMTVFPGGVVDPDDLTADALPWHGPSA